MALVECRYCGRAPEEHEPSGQACSEAMQDQVTELLRTLALGDHARPESPAAVMDREIIPAVEQLRADAERWRYIRRFLGTDFDDEGIYWVVDKELEMVPPFDRSDFCGAPTVDAVIDMARGDYSVLDGPEDT